MSVRTINDIRKAFLSYFESKNHLRLPSASLLPAQDPTLLFTTAGMVPFKEYFSGARVPPSRRIVTVQKCLRTTDLESVGKTKRHLSFFEMLGNFSFGDYFKKEAIEFAWEFSTQFLPFPKERIWISVFENDDEAYEIWNKHIGVPAARIVRLGRADNFWGPAGESGACGPCSELYLDRGEQFGTDEQNRAPGGSGDRFMEFWNLVFNQFDFQKGEYLPLAQTGIDTGAGLERLATLVQDVDSVYDTDELMRLRQKAAQVFGVEYTGDNVIPLRVITDHVRSLTFAMSDGIFPSNESRGYVLRRILRRAMLFGRKLGQKEPLLNRLCETVNAIYGEFYPELAENLPFISDYIRQEETRFLRTLDSGAERLEQLIQQVRDQKGRMLPGKEVFQLYDTYGFPLEMTIELAEAEQLAVDVNGFKAEMEKQRERGRAAWKGAIELPVERNVRTSFIGYESLVGTGKITAIVRGEQRTESLKEGDADPELCFIVTDRTPFYAEGGGQLGDNGYIRTDRGSARVVDCRRQNDAWIHLVTDIEGVLEVGARAGLSVDRERREALARHHSATHLLNAALRKVLGAHIRQSGSLVHPAYLRFDFTHPKALSAEELNAVENAVNEAIRADIAVSTVELPKAEAEKRGAVMTFGEKYGEVVRVVEMDDFSKEFCGGTHVTRTGDIKGFIIRKESSPGAGNRRIEAFAGNAAVTALDACLQEIAQALDADGGLPETTRNEFASELAALHTESRGVGFIHVTWRKALDLQARIASALQAVRKQRAKEERAASGGDLEVLAAELLSGKVTLPSGTAFAHSIVIGRNLGDLKSIADKAREKNAAVVYLVISVSGEEKLFVLATTQSYAIERSLKLNELLKAAPTALGVTGGGKSELVQGKLRGDEHALLEYIRSVV
jgi:alanyl-tRNA synthetase